MMICDAHCDTLYNLVTTPGAHNDVTMERLKEGGVALQTMAMYVGPKAPLEETEALFDRMYGVFQGLLSEGWQQAMDPQELEPGQPKMLLSIEGCEVFSRGLHSIQAWRQKGVRMAAVTWNHENALATPAAVNDTDGLKPYGLQAVREMQRLKIAVDVSHLNIAGFFDILNKTDAPPLASHSCARALRDHKRNLTDEQLRALFRAGGFVGINFYPSFLTEGPATIDHVADHIDHMMQMGGEGMVGFGSDFDGIGTKPEGLDNPADFPRVLERLKARGYSDKVLESIASGAFIRYFERI